MIPPARYSRFFRVAPGNWTTALATALRQAEPGDTIIVDEEAKRELAVEAAQQMQSTATVCLVSDDADYSRAPLNVWAVMILGGRWVNL